MTATGSMPFSSKSQKSENVSRIEVRGEQFLNPLWRLSNLYTIVDKDGVRVPFTPNTAQLRLLDDLHGKDIILKARQLGMTTLMCLVSLDECLFLPNWRAAIIAHRLDDAKAIFDTKVKFPYDQLPDLEDDVLPVQIVQ